MEGCAGQTQNCHTGILKRPLAGCRRPQIFYFSGLSGFSIRFPAFSWSGRVPAARGTHFPAPEWIFHARETNFHAQNKFFVFRNRFFPPEDCFSCIFGWFFVVGKGPGGSGDLFSCSGIDFSYPGIDFSCPDSMFMPGDSWGTPEGRLGILSCLVKLS